MEATKYNLPSQSLSEDFLLNKDSQAILAPNVNFSLTDMTHNINNKDEINKDISEHSRVDIEGMKTAETTLKSAVKSMSPTIIEHAYNVMKNLFSPDKSKSKPTGVANIIVNPVKPQQNSLETSPSSVIVQTNSLNSAESIGVGVVDDVVNVRTSGSKSSKDEMNHLGTILSPLVQDVHNNTDDSFLTTVSLIDESFQSAITHLDGNGEVLKLDSNPVENLLNDSRDLNISDLSNDSFEGNDLSMENTLLKNGSIDHLDNESNGSREGNLETLNSTQIVNCLDKGLDEKIAEAAVLPAIEFSEPLKESRVNGNSDVHLEKHQDSGNDEKVDEKNDEDVLKEVAFEEQKSVDMLPVSSSNDLKPVESCQNVQMENLFLNGRFENTQNEAETLTSDLLMTSGNVEGNLRRNAGEVQEGLLGEDKMRSDAISASSDDDYTRTNVSVVETGKHVQVDISFSTATVVLDTKESDEFEDNDGLSLSLTEDETDENFSSSSPSTSLSSPCTKSISSNEAEAMNKPPQILSSSPHKDKKGTPVKNIKNEINKSNLCVKSPSTKSSRSERSSPNKSPKSKNKLNKSADELSPTQLRDLPNQKSNSKGKESLGKNAHSTSLLVSPSEEISDGDGGKEQATEVLSQESYTILNAPEILERPVVQPPKGLGEECKTSCDVIDIPKQSTSVCEETVTPKLETCKSEELEVKTPVATTSPESKPMPAVNEEPTEFSPVTPIMDQTFAFESSSEREGANCSQYQSTGLNSTWVTSSKETSEMNRTYDKKPETPKILNQTYDKSSDAVAMNATFDKEPVFKVKPQPEVEDIETNETLSKDQTSVQLVSIQATLKDVSSSNAPVIQINLTNKTNDSSNGISGTNSSRPSYDVDPTIKVGPDVNNLNDLTRNFSTMNLTEASSPDNVGLLEDQLDPSFKLPCDPDLVQLIQEQFTSTDIEKICSVVDDISSMKLSSQIMKASEQFDKSFHESVTEIKTPGAELKPGKPVVNPLSPQSFDFLNSITGKPTGRDLSRESLYVKFDPLVQPPNANSLIDFSKEADILSTIEASPEMRETGGNVCEQLLAISPEKKPDDIVPPLTPLSHKVKANAKEDKIEKLKELQNEIFFLKNLYAEREKVNKGKMEDYENRVAKLTGENCVLEEKLKDSSEREKSLVRKLNEQSQSLEQLKGIMKEYIKVIKRLTEELETARAENEKQVENLTLEKDSYLTHLQNTEAAFTDVHAKYEKSKKTILNLKANESLYKATLVEQAAKLEEFIDKAKEAQERATTGFQKFQLELEEVKGAHAQETTRLRAQLRKTELKLEAMQESLDQKIKENEQLTAICDELIEGKK